MKQTSPLWVHSIYAASIFRFQKNWASVPGSMMLGVLSSKWFSCSLVVFPIQIYINFKIFICTSAESYLTSASWVSPARFPVRSILRSGLCAAACKSTEEFLLEGFLAAHWLLKPVCSSETCTSCTAEQLLPAPLDEALARFWRFLVANPRLSWYRAAK